jgi:hypothetical protein
MDSTQASLIQRLLEPDVLGTLVPIVAVIVGGAVWIAKLLIRHRERMAMIEMGMNPDHQPDESGAGNEVRLEATIARDH